MKFISLFLLILCSLHLSYGCIKQPKRPEKKKIDVNIANVPRSPCAEKFGGYCYKLPTMCPDRTKCKFVFDMENVTPLQPFLKKGNVTSSKPRRLGSGNLFGRVVSALKSNRPMNNSMAGKIKGDVDLARHRWLGGYRSKNALAQDSTAFEKVVGSTKTRELAWHYRAYRIANCWTPLPAVDLCSESTFCCKKPTKPFDSDIEKQIETEKRMRGESTKELATFDPASTDAGLSNGMLAARPGSDLNKGTFEAKPAFASDAVGSRDKWDPDGACSVRSGVCIPANFVPPEATPSTAGIKCTAESRRVIGLCHHNDFICCTNQE